MPVTSGMIEFPDPQQLLADLKAVESGFIVETYFYPQIVLHLARETRNAQSIASSLGYAINYCIKYALNSNSTRREVVEMREHLLGLSEKIIKKLAKNNKQMATDVMLYLRVSLI